MEPEHFTAGCVTSTLRVLAAFGIDFGLYISRVSLKMYRQTLILQLITGQNQMFVFLTYAPDCAGA